MPVRSFAVAGAIQALAYLNAGKRWVARSDTALNLYTCLIGPTASGKEDPRKAIKRLVGVLLSDSGICEHVASGTALLRAVEADRALLVLSDEFGLFLQAALSDKGPIYLKGQGAFDVARPGPFVLRRTPVRRCKNQHRAHQSALCQSHGHDNAC